MYYLNPNPVCARSPKPEPETELKENDTFDFHYAVYEFRPEGSRLSSHSYQSEPLSTKGLHNTSPFWYLIQQIIHGTYMFFYGQKSVWKAFPYSDNGLGKPVVM
jgi:hypothetical protein